MHSFCYVHEIDCYPRYTSKASHHMSAMGTWLSAFGMARPHSGVVVVVPWCPPNGSGKFPIDDFAGPGEIVLH